MKSQGHESTSPLRVILYDSDNVRHDLNKDDGFTEADRVENIRSIADVTRLMVDAGEFWEVFVDAPLDLAEHRDRKDLCRMAW